MTGWSDQPEKALVVSALATVEQVRSAGHYVIRPGAEAALGSTLKLAADLSGYPFAAVNVLDASHVHRVAEHGSFGADQDLLPVANTRDDMPCGFVLAREQALVVPDARLDLDCRALGSVTGRPGVRSYIGVPLHGREGLTIGVLHVMDTVAHPDADTRLSVLTELARVVEDQLELTRRRTEQAPAQPGASLREIRRALLAGQIRPYYQPLVDLTHNRVIGFEVLARWEHADGHLVDAEHFLPTAEDSELIVEIDRTMLARALNDASRWQPGFGDIQLSVNASGPWVRSAGFVDDVLDALAAESMPAPRLTLELTESVLLEREPRVTANLAAVRAAGCRVALDDFGTGWSSLEYLLRLPVDELKIDRTFTAALGTPTGDSLVHSTARLARDLGLSCVVEGIERGEQLRRVRETSAAVGQGFYWSAALSAGQLQHHLARTAGAVA